MSSRSNSSTRWVTLALALALGIVPLATQASATATPSGPLDTPADLAPALHFESLIPEHDVNGMIVPMFYDAWPDLNPDAQPIRMVGEGDSGNYTGVYLAGESYRYAQAKAELAALGTDPLGDQPTDSADVTFWRGQRDEAAARAEEIARYYHILVNISEYWETQFDPQVDPSKLPDDPGLIDYGGGIIQGQPGLLMRTCTPEDSTPAYRDLRMNFGGREELVGPLPWEDGRNWYCIQNTSRDSYMGTLFGLSVALDYFATPENSEIRAMIAHDLMALADYAIKYLWFQPRPHGYVVDPITDNDLNGPISPLFIQVPMARLHLLQTARHAAALIGSADAKQRYDILWKEEVANTVATGSLLDSMVIDAAGPHNAYYKYQLHLMAFFNVIRLEEDPIIKQEFMRAMAVLDATVGDDGNAFFEAMTYPLTGEPSRLEEAVTYHRQWLDYYAFHEAAAASGHTPFVHTGRCSITEDPGPDAPIQDRPLECVPKNQVDMIQPLPTGGEVRTPFQPGTDSNLRAKDPVPVGVRRLADFLWQKDPTIIGGDHDVPWRGPSIDFIATYWMLRYYSEIEPPTAVTPLPAWQGPHFE